MKIAVIIPSRLAVNPASPSGNLYLHRAIGSVRRQTIAGEHEIRIVLGLDETCETHPIGIGTDVWLTFAKDGQAAALNVAVRDAAASWAPGLFAFLEDDDIWHPQKLEYQLAGLAAGYDFVSCSQREVTPDGGYIRVNDFATMSGWLMTAQTWRDVGPFDESFKWHLDNEWLGRLNRAGKNRLHFAEHAADVAGRPWLTNVGRFSKTAMTTGLLEPLVTRTINPKGGMARIASDPVAAAESQREHMRLWEKGSVIPW